MTIEIVDLPTIDGDFPVRELLNYQRVAQDTQTWQEKGGINRGCFTRYWTNVNITKKTVQCGKTMTND